MKNFIYTYYNIVVDDIKKEEDNYYFYYNDVLFLLCLVKNDINEVEEIYQYLLAKKKSCFIIINNVKNELYSEVDKNKYILLKTLGVLNYEYTYKDFVFMPIEKKAPKDWGTLWGNRLDYYEVQLRELGIKHQSLINTFGFYSGLAENAILYYNLTISRYKDGIIVSIVHNRTKYPCYLKDYLNPVNLLYDYSIRDIAEYIKSYIFSKDYDVNYVLRIISELNLNNLMFNILYSRLLYPSFYFDSFDRIILDKDNEEIIMNSIDITDNYIKLLKSIYYTFSKKYNMFKIEWLDKIKM